MFEIRNITMIYDIEKTENICNKVLAFVNEKIKNGEKPF